MICHISSKIKWLFILCVVIGSIVVALIRVKIARRVERRYSGRKKAGRPVYQTEFVHLSDIPYHLSRIHQYANYHDICADLYWRNLFIWLAEETKRIAQRHVYWVDCCVCQLENRVNLYNLLTDDVSWKPWIGKDYIILISQEKTIMCNMKGIIRNIRQSTEDIIFGNFIVAKLSPLPQMYHR